MKINIKSCQQEQLATEQISELLKSILKMNSQMQLYQQIICNNQKIRLQLNFFHILHLNTFYQQNYFIISFSMPSQFTPNQKQVYQLLKQQGYSDKVIASIMANIDVQTGGTFDHTTQQKNGKGHGLFQFDFMNKPYNRFLTQNNLKDSKQSQIKYVASTIQGENQGDLNRHKRERIVTAFENQNSNLNQLTQIFCNEWENPGKPNMERRLQSAQKMFQKINQNNLQEIQGINRNEHFISPFMSNFQPEIPLSLFPTNSQINKTQDFTQNQANLANLLHYQRIPHINPFQTISQTSKISDFDARQDPWNLTTNFQPISNFSSSSLQNNISSGLGWNLGISNNSEASQSSLLQSLREAGRDNNGSSSQCQHM